jgi:AcrR family transcriptional regulator
VPKSRRSQEQRSQATRAALVDAARSLFSERGYAAVAADEIVAAAGLTRGALYHHFNDKRDLFRAMFEDFERSLTDEIRLAIETAGDSDSTLAVGLASFLDSCERPDVVQLALIDAPAVLGWAEWRSIEARHGLGLIRATLERAAGAGLLRPAPTDVVAHLVLSALIEAALLIAHAVDRGAARAAAEEGLRLLLSGLLLPPVPDSRP